MANINTVEIEQDNLTSILNQANKLKEAGEIEQAISKYTEALEVNPNSIVCLNQLAGIYEIQKRFSLAVEYYQKAVALIPNNAISYAKLARAMMRKRDVQSAITAYEKAVLLKEKHPQWVYLGLANALIQNKQHDKAIATYQLAIKFERQNSTFYVKMADIYFKQADFNKAVEHYEQAAKLENIRESKCYYCLAEALTKLGILERAISSYQSILQSRSSIKEECHQFLGQVIIKLSIQTGELDSAVNFFQSGLQKMPGEAWLNYYLGTVLTKQNKINQALVCYREAIENQSEFYLAYIELGKVLIQKGNLVETLNCCVKAIEINPKDINTYTFCQRWLEKFSPRLSSRHFEIMEKAYQDAIPLIQNSKPHLIRLYINLGNLYKRRGKFSEAVLSNQNASYHTTLRANSSFVQNYWKKSKLKEPNFMIIGVMKSGTTSLFVYLSKHTYILPSIQKETSYLSGLVKQEKVTANNKYLLDSSQKDWYMSYFPLRPESSNFITGESSNEYIYTNGVEKLIHNNFPKTKLIAMVRDPVKRAISQYHMLVKQGRESRSLEDALNSELDILESIGDFSNNIDRYAKGSLYLSHGLYVYFLERWFALFDSEQLLILKMRDLSENPAKFVKQTFDFLDLPDYQEIDYTPRNQGNYSPQVNNDLLSRLYKFYQPHNKKLEDYLGRKFNWDIQ